MGGAADATDRISGSHLRSAIIEYPISRFALNRNLSGGFEEGEAKNYHGMAETCRSAAVKGRNSIKIECGSTGGQRLCTQILASEMDLLADTYPAGTSN
jgi:hypothetical protein